MLLGKIIKGIGGMFPHYFPTRVLLVDDFGEIEITTLLDERHMIFVGSRVISPH